MNTGALYGPMYMYNTDDNVNHGISGEKLTSIQLFRRFSYSFRVQFIVNVAVVFPCLSTNANNFCFNLLTIYI